MLLFTFCFRVSRTYLLCLRFAHCSSLLACCLDRRLYLGSEVRIRPCGWPYDLPHFLAVLDWARYALISECYFPLHLLAILYSSANVSHSDQERRARYNQRPLRNVVLHVWNCYALQSHQQGLPSRHDNILWFHLSWYYSFTLVYSRIPPLLR